MARPRKAAQPTPERLSELIEEAIVDCYGDDEQHTGLLTVVESNLACPFPARVIGEAVTVVGFAWAGGGRPGLSAVCESQGRRYPIDVLSLEWPDPPPAGYEWVEAYRAWRAGSS